MAQVTSDEVRVKLQDSVFFTSCQTRPSEVFFSFLFPAREGENKLGISCYEGIDVAIRISKGRKP